MRHLLLPALLLLAASAAAQTTRTVQDAQLWPEVQGELTLRSGDYLLLSLHGERATGDGYYNRRLGLDSRRATVAYEHFFGEHWSLGGTVRLESNGLSYLVPEVLLRHRSLVFKGFTLGQRLSVERQISLDSYQGGSSPASETWGRLRVDVERLYPLGGSADGLALRPRLSYEATTHLRLQQASGDPDERTIQYTSLRGEVGVRVSPAFDLTPWFAYRTLYGIGLPQYDANGMQVRGGKYNYVFPTVGLDLRLTLLPTGFTRKVSQLPTQH